MEYTAPRNMTVSSVSGRSVSFEKGVPKFAPPQMHNELISMGVIPSEELPEPVKDLGSEPSLPADREAAFFAAFETMALRDKRGDFAGTGTPHSAPLAHILGWTSVDVKERDAMWKKFKADKAD